ncbi:MAG: cytochrome b/b6 domain-containing protein [Candidatus Caldarchaeum sp.]
MAESDVTTQLVRLSPEIFTAIVLAFVAGYVVHWFRRAFRQPRPKPTTVSTELVHEKVYAFDPIQRLFHWLSFVALGIMTLTGLAIYFPNVFDSFLTPFGIDGMQAKIFWHVNLAWALLGLLIIHVVWDVGVKKGWWNIWIGLKDLSDGWMRTKHFLGLVKEYKPIPKYDVFMKTFHWGLTLSLIVLGFTGVYFWNPYGLIPQIPYEIEYLFRVLHDLFAAVMIGLVIGHVYFAVLPVNWPILKAMFTGWISKDFYMMHFDPTRWKLKQQPKKLEVKK